MRRSDWLFVFVLAMTVAAVGGGLWLSDSESDRARRSLGTEPTVAEGVQIGGPFVLVDQNGTAVTDKDLVGHWSLIYFGYTFCPDVCPITLTILTQTIEALGPQGDKVTPMFITVDPKRDTVDELRAYAEHFHPRMRFLTGTDEQVTQMTRAYKIFRAIREETPNDPDYFVDHTSLVYLVGPDGKYVTYFAHNTPTAEMAARLRRLL
ncbi:MAG: SCO family protein [Alphaproteobacteria bacterium]|nr:SCO family protein [Alphaproteobacteria bacterium]